LGITEHSLLKAHYSQLKMKKLLIFTVLLSCFSVETQAETFVTNTKATISANLSETKTVVKRRRKKGFLWGIFKKKDCGCPKH
jgi:ribosome biogenesis protein Nip4